MKCTTAIHESLGTDVVFELTPVANDRHVPLQMTVVCVSLAYFSHTMLFRFLCGTHLITEQLPVVHVSASADILLR
eukprot:m.488035 g.488035  ORF g.488035 m.488035 type:complete len:76 (-) comp21761_c0_seq3:570-797(-)